jgi:hypothetical protein
LVKVLLLISDVVKGIGQCELGIILLLFKLSYTLISVVQRVLDVKFPIELNYELEEVFEQGLIFEILELMLVDEVFEFCKTQVIESKVPTIIKHCN